MHDKQMAEFVAKVSNDIAEEIDCGETREQLRDCIAYLTSELGHLRLRIPEAEENAQLRALLGASLEDTERMNWFEAQYANLRMYYVHGAREDHRATWAAPRLRELIDQARANPDFGK